MNWKHFCFASVLVGAVLIKYGAPLFTVVAGVGAMLAFNIYRLRRAGATRAR